MKLRKDTWETVVLGDVCEIDPSKKELINTPNDLLVSFAEMADLNEYKSQFSYSKEKTIKELRAGGLSYFKNNDVLLAKMTPCFENGKSGFAENLRNGIGFGSTEFFVLRSNKIIPRLLYFVISSNQFIEKGKLMMLGTTGRKRLMKDFVAHYEIPLPPLEEQHRIADLFQSVEQSITQAEEQERRLKALQKSLSNDLVDIPPIFGNLLTTKNCKPCSVGDIADCIEQYDKKPLENGITRFIGLENIEPDNFILQGFGNIKDGTTFTKCFSKGDVLFGKRRAYLKKVAVADFDGICSGDILVFRAKENKMLPELLPYYISSEAFIKQAVSTSAGSLSPRTKWRDLVVFKISVPDIKTQAKIVDIFNQLSVSLQLIIKQKSTLKKLKQKLLNDILG